MTDSASAFADPFAFLGHHGETSELIRQYDWSRTPLGRVESWPACLKCATALLLQSPIPLVMLWGEEGVMIYNDAYSVFAGYRHPELFGSNVREGWAEIADFNDNVMRAGLSGRTLTYRDQELTLYRKGYPEQVWMDLAYSPVPDDEGNPAGVIAIVVETTERVLAERRNREESQRLQNLFEQAPTFMAMISADSHRFEMVNPEYQKLIGGRDVVGVPFREALPEVVDQGYDELLANVFEAGHVVRRSSERVLLRRSPEGPLEERFLDFVYQPIREDGAVTHIFVQGSDVTERVRAERHQELLINELNHRVKNTLASIQAIVSQTLKGPQSREEASASITARILALSRAHDVLTSENWDGADLHEIVDSALDAFRREGREAFKVRGLPLRVGPHAALSIALALHELATNALKYGSLSTDQGTVTVEWLIAVSNRFVLTWLEQGGPTVVKGSREGFGSRLILRVLPRELQGVASIEYLPTGVTFKLETDLRALNDRPLLDGQ